MNRVTAVSLFYINCSVRMVTALLAVALTLCDSLCADFPLTVIGGFLEDPSGGWTN